MSVTAVVERVSNGYVVAVNGEKFVATDCIDLANVFEEVFEVPEERVDLTRAGREALAGLDLLTGEELLRTRGDRAESELTEAVEGTTETQRPAVDVAAEWGDGTPIAPAVVQPRGEGSPAEVRVPVADDGYEFPPVKQLGANHFVVACPLHGDQRMERRGVAWVCPRKDKTAECTTRIPREAMQRALRAA